MTAPASKARPCVVSYRDLLVWQKAMTLVAESYAIAPELPPSERFGLGQQLARAAVSVAANIAEGQGRLSPRDFARHCSIARGSLTELTCLLEIATLVGHLPAGRISTALATADEVGRMLWALTRSLRNPRGGAATQRPA